MLGSGFRVASEPYSLVIAPQGELVRLQSISRGRRILLDVSIDYRVAVTSDPHEPFVVRTESYLYRFLTSEEHEFLAFHWHPIGLSDVVDPHLHLSSRLNPIDMGRNQDPLPLAEMHIPTGFVTLEDVVRLLIAEFGIRPRRPDWETVLRENRTSAHIEQAG